MNDNDGGSDAAAEAAQWYARLKTLPVSRQTLEGYFAWRRIDGHAETFDAVDQFYSATGQIGVSPPILAATDAAYYRRLNRRQKWTSRASLGVGLVALALVSTGLAGRWLLRSHHYATGIGEQREIALEDGSKVTLDTDTRITVRYTDKARAVIIDHGQAYFAVVHNAARPFTVEAGSTTVIDTGTQFDVRRLDDQTDVTLVCGSVSVRTPNEVDSHLLPGQSLRIRADQEPLVKTVDPLRSTAWTHGRIIFDGVPLSTAIDEVNRYTRHQVVLDAARFGSARFSGSLDAGDVPSFIAAVTAILPLKSVTDDDGSIHLIG